MRRGVFNVFGVIGHRSPIFVAVLGQFLRLLATGPNPFPTALSCPRCPGNASVKIRKIIIKEK
jgi:hypothetical protein